MAIDRKTCFIIAEAGVNHNGSVDLAHRLVDAAADAGANAVKFQTFRAEKLASVAAPKAAYQARETGNSQSQLEMLRALELTEPAHRELIQHCAERGIEFMSSPFDTESLAFLVSLGVRQIKLGSGELTNAPMLLAAAKTGLPLILSTGMSTLAEVEAALGVLAFGYFGGDRPPSRHAFCAAWASAVARTTVRDKIVLLHCTTEYPAPRDQINLRAMLTLRSAFDIACGYSDHTDGIAVSMAAAALGASVIEKHFTLDCSLPGPDHKASLEPLALRALIEGVREVEAAMGDGVKVPVPVELPNRVVARKSLVAAREIRAGEIFSPENVTMKRPGNGISPMDCWEWFGRPARRGFAKDETID